IALAARHARRHRNGVTWTKRPLDPLAVFLHVTGHLSLQHEEDLLDVVVGMERTLVARRNHHGAEREMLRWDGVGIRPDTGGAGTHVAHLRTAVSRIDLL